MCLLKRSIISIEAVDPASNRGSNRAASYNILVIVCKKMKLIRKRVIRSNLVNYIITKSDLAK